MMRKQELRPLHGPLDDLLDNLQGLRSRSRLPSEDECLVGGLVHFPATTRMSSLLL